MPVLLASPKWCHFGPSSLPPEWHHVLFTFWKNEPISLQTLRKTVGEIDTSKQIMTHFRLDRFHFRFDAIPAVLPEVQRQCRERGQHCRRTRLSSKLGRFISVTKKAYIYKTSCLTKGMGEFYSKKVFQGWLLYLNIPRNPEEISKILGICGKI